LGGRALVALVVALLPATAMAQSGLRVTAALEFAQTYDDNLFPSPTALVRQSDFIYRIGPRLGLVYAGRTLNVRARYGRDAEAFGWRHELDSTRARQDAGLDVGWSPFRALKLDAGALYEDTTMARDLNVVTALETARLPAQRSSARASASLRLGGLTQLRAEEAFERQRTSGFAAVDTRIASIVLERTFGPLDNATMNFSRREFSAEGSVTRSHVLALGWSRRVMPRARFEIQAGPRLSNDGTVGAEVSVGVRGALRHGEVAFAYIQTEATAAGHLGRLAVQGVSASLRHQLSRGLRIGGGAGIFESREQRSEALVYHATAELEGQLAQSVALIGTYTWSRQEGNIGGPALRDIPHNTFSLRLAAGSASARGAR